MTDWKDIYSFFNQVRLEEGAIWIEKETIRLSTSRKLQNAETKKFITDHKSRIISILNENKIFSKDRFLNVLIFRNNNSTSYPLSPAQERLWFIEQYEQGSNAYHIPALFELDAHTSIKGIKYALQQIVSRHEVLRSTIEQGNNPEYGIQRVHDKPLWIEEIKLTDNRSYKLLVKDAINRPFNLSDEYPIRVKFYTVHSKKTLSGFRVKKIYLLINIHHIAADGWSMDIFEKELLAYYKAYVDNDKGFCLPAPEIQYKDYSLWQRAFLTGPVLEKQLSYWKKKLSDYQDLKIPTDFVRPNRVDYRGAHEKFILSRETSKKLRALAQLHRTTLHVVMLSSINILLNKYTGQDDIVIGSPIANRHHRETEELIGFFVNMQVSRTILNRVQSFEDLIKQVHREQVQAQLYQDLPFGKLVDELGVNRDMSRHPVFQVMFSVQNFGNQPDRNKQKFSRKSFQAEGFYEVEKFDLSFLVDDSHAELMGQVSYATSLFHTNTIKRLIDHYTYLLDQLTKAPKGPYSQISLVKPREYKQIVDQWNRTFKKYPKDSTINQLFQKQAEITPGHIALVYEGQSLTYQQLNEKTNQLARYIRKQYLHVAKEPLVPDTLIALYLNRSLEMVIGILAVMKAGGAYVPIDISYPQERIDYLLEDTEAKLILSQKKANESNAIQLPQEKVIPIDLSEALYNKEDSSNLPQYNQAANLAYVIYTSGTTGRPRGVMVEQHSLINTIYALYDVYDKRKIKKITAFTSYSFDVSVSEIFAGLLQGLELHILSNPTRSDVVALSDYLIEHNINLVYLPPVLLSQLPDKVYPALHRLIYAGEPCDRQTAKAWSAKLKLFNYYGPTELTIYATGMQILVDEVEQIGKPVQNNKVYVLAPDQMPVPIGITGELYAGGAGVARGYLNRPELTKERFIPNPFATEADRANGYTRLYRTGDLVRWLPDGKLEYIGRNDDQVKIRGFRIELGEIEHVLSQIRGVRQNCVLVKERKTGSGSTKYLVGYYVSDKADETLTPTRITEKLSRVLPEYMVPDELVPMESFPVTSNGKLDKRALPDPEFGNSPGEYVAPSGKKEKEICKIWEKILGQDRVGLTDNFFRIGGNSISAIQASYRMSKALGYNVGVADLFRFKSIDSLLAAGKQDFELVRPYHSWQRKRMNDMIFIHPGHGGSEVYQDLADLLSSNYNCIGIENYNQYHREKIRSLNKLAHYYLSAYEKKYTLREPVHLLGWSLGGLIALEIAAILELRGFKNIQVFLLDTFFRPGKIPGTARQKSSKYPEQKKKTPAKQASPYAEELTAAFEAGIELAKSPISHLLQQTRVVLFKAAKKDSTPGKNNIDPELRGPQTGKPTANNIGSASAHVEVINLNCSHEDILPKSGMTIANKILHGPAKKKW